MNKDGQRTTQFHVGEPIGIRIKTVLAEDLYTFIKKIELSNGDGAKALLINNFCRPNEIKTLVFNYAETKHLFDTAGQGRFERFMSKVDGPNGIKYFWSVHFKIFEPFQN